MQLKAKLYNKPSILLNSIGIEHYKRTSKYPFEIFDSIKNLKYNYLGDRNEILKGTIQAIKEGSIPTEIGEGFLKGTRAKVYRRNIKGGQQSQFPSSSSQPRITPLK